MALHYSDVLRQLVDTSNTIKPKKGRALLISRLGSDEGSLPPYFSTDALIRRKISALNTALRKG